MGKTAFDLAGPNSEIKETDVYRLLKPDTPRGEGAKLWIAEGGIEAFPALPTSLGIIGDFATVPEKVRFFAEPSQEGYGLTGGGPEIDRIWGFLENARSYEPSPRELGR